MNKFKYAAVFLSGFMMMALFQNCGESLDLSDQQYASTAPGVSLSYATSALQENNSYEIRLVIRNIDTFSIQWWKDGEALEGFTGNTLIFEPARSEDAGVYYASVQVDLETTYITDEITLTVAEDLTETDYSNPGILLNNQTYFLISRNADINQQTANAYCKRVVGPNAVATDFTASTVPTSTQRLAYASDQAACVNPVAYETGLCFRFIPDFFEDEEEDIIRNRNQERRITSVSCRPEPIQGL